MTHMNDLCLRCRKPYINRHTRVTPDECDKCASRRPWFIIKSIRAGRLASARTSRHGTSQ